MMKSSRRARFAAAFLALGLMIVFSASPAAAALTADQAKQFVDAMPAVSALSGDMRKTGRDKLIEKEIRATSGDTFSPLLRGMPIMQEKFPADYKALNDIAVRYGFSSAEDWAGVGDRVMLTYMAIKSETNPEILTAADNIPAEQIAVMPPEVKQQLNMARAMVKAASAVPEAERAVVRPLVPAIEDDMKKAEEAEAARAQQPQ